MGFEQEELGPMNGPSIDGSGEGAAPGMVRLLGKAGNKIEADVSNADTAEDFVSPVDVRAAVHASGRLELLVDKGLRAETDAIDAGSQPMTGFCCVNGLGVGFEGDFLYVARKAISDGAE